MNTSASVIATEIESSAEFQALLVAAAGKPERSMGESVIPAEPPVWTDVRRRAKELLLEPVHVSVIVHLIKADAHVGGFTAMRESLQLLQDRLTGSWDSMLPVADPDDADDPFYERVNYLREVAEDPTFVNSLKSVQLVNVRGLGSFSARDIDIANGQLSASEEEQARCQEGLIRAAFEQVDESTLQDVAASLADTMHLTIGVEKYFDENAGSEHGLSFAPMRKLLEGIDEKFRAYAGSRLEASEQSVDVVESSEGTNPTELVNDVKGSSVGSGSKLGDRQSVTDALDQIIGYYQNHEPSSPVPILAQRGRDMVTKSFFDVLEDLAPTQKGDLASLLDVLGANPVASLLNDSYQAFLAGERITQQTPTTVNGVNTDSDTSGNDTGEQLTSPETIKSQDMMDTVLQVSLQSRNDVAELLNSIDGYFDRYEPSSPVPLVIAEIRKLLPKRFTELIE
ncbi:MAG: ImpA family type VI secretion system protein, partial [Granulosicoccus sp.]